jgi:hypothetical protein
MCESQSKTEKNGEGQGFIKIFELLNPGILEGLPLDSSFT